MAFSALGDPFFHLQRPLMSDHEHDLIGHTPSPLLEGSAPKFNSLITYVQAFTLVAITIAAIIGISSSILEMIETHIASLGDLLLLFLYVEILSMIKGSALGTREIPIRTPVALAIVAISRFFVVDVEHMTPTFMLMTSGAIFVLVIALWVLSRLPNRY